MTRSIRLVVIVSSPVPSDDDETKLNAEKHECSLLKVVSDAGSTPAASTNSKSRSVVRIGSQFYTYAEPSHTHRAHVS